MQEGPESLVPFYSASLVKLQVEFVSPIPANVKNLIRLVKYWRKTYVPETATRRRLPASYVLELITIHGSTFGSVLINPVPSTLRTLFTVWWKPWLMYKIFTSFGKTTMPEVFHFQKEFTKRGRSKKDESKFRDAQLALFWSLLSPLLPF